MVTCSDKHFKLFTILTLVRLLKALLVEQQLISKYCVCEFVCFNNAKIKVQG